MEGKSSTIVIKFTVETNPVEALVIVRDGAEILAQKQTVNKRADFSLEVQELDKFQLKAEASAAGYECFPSTSIMPGEVDTIYLRPNAETRERLAAEAKRAAEKERERLIAALDCSPEMKETIRHKQIQAGMTAEQVRLSWGSPESKTAEDGNREFWHYRTDTLFFTAGVLTHYTLRRNG